MRIMGIDPGLNATGYGVIIAEPGGVQLVGAGVIRPPIRQPFAKRLLTLYDALADVIETYHPRLTVLESLYTHHQYVTTATLMAHARGIVSLISAQHNLSLVEYSPTRVRKALTGNGSASKEQVARVVYTWLGVQESSWSSDATDALALAIAHAQISKAPVIERETGRTQRHVEVFPAASGTRR